MRTKLGNLKLNIIFYLIIIFSVVLPICISAFLLIASYKHEAQIAEENNKRLEQQILINLNLLLSEIKSELNSLAQHPDIIELLTTKMEFRRFVENRAFGRLQEMSLKLSLPIHWYLFNVNSVDPILSSSKKELPIAQSKKAEGFELSPDRSHIVVRKDIRLDDQNLSGPTSNLRGNLTLTISFSEIAKTVDGLISITNLDSDASLKSHHIQFKKPVNSHSLLLFSIILLAIVLLFSFFSGLFLMRTYILKPIDKISSKLRLEMEANFEVQKNKNELQILDYAINTYVEQQKTIEKEKSEKVRVEAISSITRQVAHDIRSPLSALNLVSGTLLEISEEKRLLIRNAVQRINDIANQLLENSKHSSVSYSTSVINSQSKILNNELKIELLSSVIDSIVSEKRIQYRELQDVVIEADINQGYGLFARVNTVELQRMISNLLNNSVEALNNAKGNIKVVIRGYSEVVNLIIQDDGCGIPEYLVNKLGKSEISYGKSNTESGSGLGLFHAKKTTENFGGKFEILSKEGLGTTIVINLPRAQAPHWFVQKITLNSQIHLASLDDDIAIHQIWKERLQSLNREKTNKITHFTFTSGEEFKNWVLNQKIIFEENENYLFLIDYELLGQPKTGLDIIEQLGIAKHSILVTSRYEELKIRERCEIMGIQIIPKTMAGFVPIEFSS